MNLQHFNTVRRYQWLSRVSGGRHELVALLVARLSATETAEQNYAMNVAAAEEVAAAAKALADRPANERGELIARITQQRQSYFANGYQKCRDTTDAFKCGQELRAEAEKLYPIPDE